MKLLTLVTERSLSLSETQRERQIKRGLFVTHRGEPLAIPVDSLRNRETYLNRHLWRQDSLGRVFRPGVRWKPIQFTFQKRALEFLRDHVHRGIPRAYYTAVLGHDLHVSTWGELYGRHWHAGWANPFEPDNIEPSLDPWFTTFFSTHYVDHECDMGALCPK